MTNTTVKEALACLWAGKPLEASRIIESRRKRLLADEQEIRRRLAAIEDEFRMLDEVRAAGVQQTTANSNTKPRESGQPKVSEAPLKTPQLNPSARFERRAKVVEVVQMYMIANGLQQGIKVEEAADAVTKAGLDIMVPENRLITAVANMMFRSPDRFERVKEGMYRLIASPAKAKAHRPADSRLSH